jgi:membrane protease YdiL (CAAX protease family)
VEDEDGVTPPPVSRPPLRPAIALAATLGVLALGLLVAGPLHRALEALGIHGEFARTLRYSLLVLLVALLLVLGRPWRTIPRDLYGLRGERSRPSRLAMGAALSFAFLGIVAVAQAAAGWVTWDAADGPRKLVQRAPAILAKAAILGLAEELFFRGWLLATFRRRLAVLPAAIGVAVIFGVLHAFRVTDAAKDAPPDLSGALQVLRSWWDNVVDGPTFWPRFTGVVLLSMVLTAAYLRSRTLWAPIGIHGGAVLFLDVYSALTHRRVDQNWAGSKWLYDGLPAWVLMAALAFALWPRRGAGDLATQTPEERSEGVGAP